MGQVRRLENPLIGGGPQNEMTRNGLLFLEHFEACGHEVLCLINTTILEGRNALLPHPLTSASAQRQGSGTRVFRKR